MAAPCAGMQATPSPAQPTLPAQHPHGEADASHHGGLLCGLQSRERAGRGEAGEWPAADGRRVARKLAASTGRVHGGARPALPSASPSGTAPPSPLRSPCRRSAAGGRAGGRRAAWVTRVCGEYDGGGRLPGGSAGTCCTLGSCGQRVPPASLQLSRGRAGGGGGLGRARRVEARASRAPALTPPPAHPTKAFLAPVDDSAPARGLLRLHGGLAGLQRGAGVQDQSRPAGVRERAVRRLERRESSGGELCQASGDIPPHDALRAALRLS